MPEKMIRLRDAAIEVGVTVPSVLTWMYARGYKTQRLPGNVSMIPRRYIDQYLHEREERRRKRGYPEHTPQTTDLLPPPPASEPEPTRADQLQAQITEIERLVIRKQNEIERQNQIHERTISLIKSQISDLENRYAALVDALEEESGADPGMPIV